MKKQVQLRWMKVYPSKLEAGMLVLRPNGDFMRINESDAMEENSAIKLGSNPVWNPVKPCLVCDEAIDAGSPVLLPSGESRVMTNSDMIHYLDSESNATKKIVVFPEQIGWVRHLPEGSSFISEFSEVPEQYIRQAINNGGICYIEMEDEFTDSKKHINTPFFEGEVKPRLVEGKVIIQLP